MTTPEPAWPGDTPIYEDLARKYLGQDRSIGSVEVAHDSEGAQPCDTPS